MVRATVIQTNTGPASPHARSHQMDVSLGRRRRKALGQFVGVETVYAACDGQDEDRVVLGDGDLQERSPEVGGGQWDADGIRYFSMVKTLPRSGWRW